MVGEHCLCQGASQLSCLARPQDWDSMHWRLKAGNDAKLMGTVRVSRCEDFQTPCRLAHDRVYCFNYYTRGWNELNSLRALFWFAASPRFFWVPRWDHACRFQSHNFARWLVVINHISIQNSLIRRLEAQRWYLQVIETTLDVHSTPLLLLTLFLESKSMKGNHKRQS